ncbi:uncharacterized protein BJ212DRAFT_1352249 [Suillus subaureus]|uniref:Uncharacterized protein n=1 Tax=Suillus subaureus TaxID=48587 RepID=A0A9P7ECE0_9AGAM|nr:uncharacterized protein BJ212DRAFT_1352249 [Suillus subaureus]KAG1817292.1 hypothetical protein BJ212DRAFT_1352249 [Suillus subaureus]
MTCSGLTQALHAQGNHAANSSPTSGNLNHQPTLRSIDSGDDLSNYRITCNIDAACYRDDKEITTNADVVLNLGFT